IALSAFLVLVLVWGIASYLSLRSGAKAANKRLPDSANAALVTQSGLMLTHPSVILLLGTDHSSKIRDRNSFQRSDSIMLLRTDKSDSPYATQARCDRWQGWRFAKGMQHMNGQRARVYSRIRENKLNPRESDVTRTERQQAVIQALLAKLTGLGVMVKLPWI